MEGLLTLTILAEHTTPHTYTAAPRLTSSSQFIATKTVTVRVTFWQIGSLLYTVYKAAFGGPIHPTAFKEKNALAMVDLTDVWGLG